MKFRILIEVNATAESFESAGTHTPTEIAAMLGTMFDSQVADTNGDRFSVRCVESRYIEPADECKMCECTETPCRHTEGT